MWVILVIYVTAKLIFFRKNNTKYHLTYETLKVAMKIMLVLFSALHSTSDIKCSPTRIGSELLLNLFSFPFRHLAPFLALPVSFLPYYQRS